MDVVIAAVVPALISLTAGAWLWVCLRRYFAKFLAARGPVARAKPWLKFGLGLDDLMVGAWDLMPAWRIVNRDTGDPELEFERRRAHLAALLFIAQLPGAFVEALTLVALLNVWAVTPVVVAFASWFVAALPIQTRIVWLSRPELREFQFVALRAWALVFAIVAGSLLIGGLVVAVALALRR